MTRNGLPTGAAHLTSGKLWWFVSPSWYALLKPIFLYLIFIDPTYTLALQGSPWLSDSTCILLPFTFHHTGKITKHFFWFPMLLRVANWTQLWLMRHKKGLQRGSGKPYFIHSSLLSALIIATTVQPGITDADPHIPEQNTTSGHLPLDFLLLRKSKPYQSWGTLTQGFLCWNLKTHPFNTHNIWSHWKFKYLFHLITPCILTERKYFHKLLQLAGKDILSLSTLNNLKYNLTI